MPAGPDAPFPLNIPAEISLARVRGVWAHFRSVMRGKRQTNRGRNTRAGGDAGPDLFSQDLAGVVKQAFAEAKIEADSPGPAPQTDAVDVPNSHGDVPVVEVPAVEAEEIGRAHV